MVNEVDNFQLWIELVSTARKSLLHNQYQEWKFIVGYGPLDERIELGKQALELLKPKLNEAHILHRNSPLITAGKLNL